MSAAKRHCAFAAASDGPLLRRSKRKIVINPTNLSAHINFLPLDVLSLILSYVPLRPRLLCVAAVCHRWRDSTYRSVRAIKWTPCGPGAAETLHQRFSFLRDLCIEGYKGQGEFKLPARIERIDFAGTCACSGDATPLGHGKHMRKCTAEAVARMAEESRNTNGECLYLTTKPLAHLGVRLDDLFYTAVPLLGASVATLTSLSLAAKDVTWLPALHTFFARLHLPLLVRLHLLDVADTSLPVVRAILHNHAAQVEDFRLSPPRGEQLCAALAPVCNSLSFPSLLRLRVDGLSHQFPLASFARLMLGARKLRSLSLRYFTWIPEAEDEMMHFLRTAPLQVRAALTKLVTSSRRMSDFVIQNADLFPGLRLLDGPIWQAPGRAPQVTQRVYTTLETHVEADMWQYLPQYTNLRALHVTTNAFLRGAIDPPPRFRLPHLAKVHLSCTEGNVSLCDTLAFFLDTANAPSLEHVYLHLWFGGSRAEIAAIIAHLKRQTRRHKTLLVEVMFALRFGLQEEFDKKLASEKANGWLRVKCL